MKHTFVCSIALVIALVAGCGGEKQQTVDSETPNAPLPRVGLGRPSLEGSLEQLQTPKERADQIHKWIDAKLDPKLLRPAVQKYVNDPDPDVAAAAKEAMGTK